MTSAPRRSSGTITFNGTVRYQNCLNASAWTGLSPEDRDRVAVDLGQEIVDVWRWRELVVAVEAEVAVAPVQRPRLGADRRHARTGRSMPAAPGAAASPGLSS